jgi:Uma2 family endonuclease
MRETGCYNRLVTEQSQGRPEAERPTRLTYDDLARFPDDGKRREIIDGELFVTPSPFTRHQQIVGNLYWLIRSFLEEHPVGHVYLAPLDVVFTKYDVVEPDLLFVSNERREVITVKNLQGAPDLVIEVLSEGTRRTDEIRKRRLYDERGVAEYWIVDPEVETVKVYRRGGEAFARVAELSNEIPGEVLTTPLLPALSIPLRRLFAE